ncbi:Estrogen receptor beta [Acipenser ruthenus]|uniref:Estrogen receptor beta n=1 Tax=Acipenser ruthenus TaxID=7906 RepID=A0A444UWR1_ACIRT|nr:Estrogen receptor beta [Acipenser ruthenus]
MMEKKQKSETVQKLEKKVEKLQDQLSEAKCSNQTLKNKLAETKNLQLIDFRESVTRLLGFNTNTMSIPDHEILSQLKSSVQPYGNQGDPGHNLDGSPAGLHYGFRDGYNKPQHFGATAAPPSQAKVQYVSSEKKPGHNDYICPATNQCTIDKNRRKSCQACRLRKCYEVGMMKCGTRRERSNYRIVRHRRLSQGQVQPSSKASKTNESGLLQTRRIHFSSLSPEMLMSSVIEAEPPEIYLMSCLMKPFTEATVLTSLTTLADKELVYMVSWAKKIPGFVELGVYDQECLLECCWLEVLMVGLMWRSINHPGNLVFASDLILNRDDGNCVEGLVEVFDMLLAITSKFRELNLQREEYLCLKVMVLLNSSKSAEVQCEKKAD